MTDEADKLAQYLDAFLAKRDYRTYSKVLQEAYRILLVPESNKLLAERLAQAFFVAVDSPDRRLIARALKSTYIISRGNAKRIAEVITRNLCSSYKSLREAAVAAVCDRSVIKSLLPQLEKTAPRELLHPQLCTAVEEMWCYHGDEQMRERLSRLVKKLQAEPGQAALKQELATTLHKLGARTTAQERTGRFKGAIEEFLVERNLGAYNKILKRWTDCNDHDDPWQRMLAPLLSDAILLACASDNARLRAAGIGDLSYVPNHRRKKTDIVLENLFAKQESVRQAAAFAVMMDKAVALAVLARLEKLEPHRLLNFELICSIDCLAEELNPAGRERVIRLLKRLEEVKHTSRSGYVRWKIEESLYSQLHLGLQPEGPTEHDWEGGTSR